MPSHTRRTFLKIGGGVLGGIAAGSTVTAATYSDRFIVDVKKKTDLSDVEIVHDLRDEIGYVVVEGSKSDVKALGADYAPDTRYELDLPVDQNEESPAEDARDDSLYQLQWDKHAQSIPDAHEVSTGEGSRIAIIDTGVYAGHPDLQDVVNTELGRNFTGDGYPANEPVGGYHGTHVAGIAAASASNDVGVVGTAPDAEVVDCRVFSTGPFANFGDMLAALVYSANIGCDAANMSIGAYPVSRKGIGAFYGGVLNRTVTYTNSQGTLLVVSAGNAGADLQHDGHVCVEDDEGNVECFPAISLPNEGAQAMSISATGPIGFGWGDEGFEDPPESPAFYTNYGTNAIDIGAPGGDVDLEAYSKDVDPWYLDLVLSSVAEPIYGDTPEGEPPTYEGVGDVGWGWAAGTSMAAPQVTGAAALVASLYHGPRKAQANKVENVLERTAEVPEGFGKEYYGHGFLNPLAAVQDME